MSTLSVSNITDGTDTVGTSYVVNGSAKHWVNFDGTGTVSVRGSFNNSSITDNGTGYYRLTRTTSMNDVNNHVPNANCEETNGGYNRSATATSTSTGYNDVRFFNTGSNSLFDGDYGYLNVHGDLA